MRAFTLDSFESAPHLRDDLEAPRIGAHDILVRVHASSVNGADVSIAAGATKGMVEHEFPVTLGRDYAGVVEEAGSEVYRHSAGDEVYGFLPVADPTVHAGSWADYIVVPEDVSVAPKPADVDFATAGVAPLAAITALAAIDALELAEGDTVLVIGATGGVGSFFVQLAAGAGAIVIAPAFPEDSDYVRGLGASEIIDRDADVAAQVRSGRPDGVDAVLDVVSFTPDASVLNEDGRLASPLGAAGDGPGRTNVVASPSSSNLERLGKLLDAGDLRVSIQGAYPLEQAGEALESLRNAHTRGKLAIQIS